MANIKIVATSDLHGNLPEIEEKFDLMLICGDICPSFYYNVNFFQDEWLRTEFKEWVNKITGPHSKVIMTPGNHDAWFENARRDNINRLENDCKCKLKVLRHESCYYWYSDEDGELKNIKIFGTPYCRIFGTWAFMHSDNYLTNAYYSIPGDTDILISHDAPNIYGLGDITEGKYQQKGTGNPILTEALYLVRPRIFHCGHFHSGNHEFAEHDGIWMANVSLVNEQYVPVNGILRYNYDSLTKEVTNVKFN